MAATSVARKLKRARKPAAKLAVTGTAAAMAASLAMGSAPLASADISIQQQVLTAGPLVNLLPALGVTSVGPIKVTNVSGIGDIYLTLNLSPIAYDTQNIYNTINALPFQRRPGLIVPANFFDRVYANAGPTSGQFPAVLTSGIGSDNAVDAYRNQLAAVANNGLAPNGFTPFQPSATNGVPNTTNQELLLLRNPYRPNGGIESRFAPILNLFGVDTTMPAAGSNTSPNGKIILNTGTLDLSWAYDPVSDFPVTLNPFSIVNSLLAGLPTNLLGGINSNLHLVDGNNPNNPVPTDTTALGLNVASVLGILNRVSLGALGVDNGKAYYGTLLPNDLPILEPLRLPSRLINAIFGTDLGTPLADALQPALKILVNTGYTDVITPDKLNTCAVDCGGGSPQTYAQLGYQAYDRSFLTPSITQPFLSKSPLTAQEWAQVPGDVFHALIGGFFPGAAASVPPASASSTAAAASPVNATVPAPAASSIPAVKAAAARSVRKPAAARAVTAPAAASATAGDTHSAATPKPAATRASRSAR